MYDVLTVAHHQQHLGVCLYTIILCLQVQVQCSFTLSASPPRLMRLAVACNKVSIQKTQCKDNIVYNQLSAGGNVPSHTGYVEGESWKDKTECENYPGFMLRFRSE